MKKISLLILLISIFSSGCVAINLPGVEPLTEKVIGGEGGDKVLIIDISGLITDEEKRGALGIERAPRLTARVREELDLASKDRRVRAVILRINSPGGAVTACDIINHEIRLFKERNKGVYIVSELMDVAASGGYFVALATDKIVAHPTTVTGSIGVVAFGVNAKGLMEKIGLTNQTIKSGDKKDIGSPLREMTGEEREILVSVIDGMYERFLNALTEGRSSLAALKREELRKIADGRIYTAEQALGLKLIDRVGYMEDAIEEAKEGAGIKEATIVTYAPARAYRHNIYSSLESAPRSINLINIEASSLTELMGMRFMYLWMP